MKTLLSSALLVAWVSGCGALRPTANRGHDLIENPGRSAAIRFPAGIGALVGHGLALPFTLLLIPIHPFTDATVETPDGYGKNREVGDIQIPLALGPQEYGSGIGAAVFGMPFDWIARPFRDKPVGMPPGAIEEEPEPPPGTVDPRLSFEVSPPPPLPPATPSAPAPAPAPAGNSAH